MALFQGEYYVEVGYAATGYVYNTPPYTTIGPNGLPIAYNYDSSKTVSGTKTFTVQVTKLSATGLPFSIYGRAGVNVVERPDTVLAQEIVDRTGDAVFTEDNDSVSAHGFVSDSYSNLWFNSNWFNAAWFNSSWFNTQDTATGTANFTNDNDTIVATAIVFISGTAAFTEDRDTSTSYGFTGNDVTGSAAFTNNSDYRAILGRVLIQGNTTYTNLDDTLSSEGSVGIISLQLSWEIVGGLNRIDIYRSTDGVNYTQIASVGGATTSYIDAEVSSAVDYYYYLVGTTTTSVLTSPSSVVYVDVPN